MTRASSALALTPASHRRMFQYSTRQSLEYARLAIVICNTHGPSYSGMKRNEWWKLERYIRALHAWTGSGTRLRYTCAVAIARSRMPQPAGWDSFTTTRSLCMSRPETGL